MPFEPVQSGNCDQAQWYGWAGWQDEAGPLLKRQPWLQDRDPGSQKGSEKGQTSENWMNTGSGNRQRGERRTLKINGCPPESLVGSHLFTGMKWRWSSKKQNSGGDCTVDVLGLRAFAVQYRTKLASRRRCGLMCGLACLPHPRTKKEACSRRHNPLGWQPEA